MVIKHRNALKKNMQGKIGFHKEKTLLQEKSVLDHSHESDSLIERQAGSNNIKKKYIYSIYIINCCSLYNVSYQICCRLYNLNFFLPQFTIFRFGTQQRFRFATRRMKPSV
jgi:hypothetical protein